MLKYCPQCTETLLLTDFHRNKARYDGHASWCKNCVAANDQTPHRQVSHRQSAKGYTKRHSLRVQQTNRNHRHKNKEHIRRRERAAYARNPLPTKARVQRYEQRHPENAIERNARHRARKINAPLSDLTHAQWVEIQEAQDHRCYYCGKRCKGRLTQDHIIPLSKGGSHTLHNVIGACQSCNSRKGTKGPLCPVQPLLLTIASPRKRSA